jgi:hypothetical protein
VLAPRLGLTHHRLREMRDRSSAGGEGEAPRRKARTWGSGVRLRREEEPSWVCKSCDLTLSGAFVIF